MLGVGQPCPIVDDNRSATPTARPVAELVGLALRSWRRELHLIDVLHGSWAPVLRQEWDIRALPIQLFYVAKWGDVELQALRQPRANLHGDLHAHVDHSDHIDDDVDLFDDDDHSCFEQYVLFRCLPEFKL